MSLHDSTRRLRVALVSVSLGRVRRGFERYFGDLADILRNDLDLTLYRGPGRLASHERVPPMLAPARAVARVLPLGKRAGAAHYEGYRADCLAFALTLVPDLRRNRYDVVHCIDPPLARVLARLHNAFGLRCRILFTEGCAMPPDRYPPVAHIHHVGQAALLRALEAGVPESRMTLVPCGLHTERFRVAGSRRDLRSKHGVSEDAFVVLAVTAVRRTHKRVDYLIDELANVEGNVLLWIDGNLEDPALPALARERLGDRCRVTHVPSEQVSELYRVADVLVQPSLEEAFGLAVVEALASGLPVLVHDSPHFRWLVGDEEGSVDMRTAGRLAARLREMCAARTSLATRAESRASMVRERFEWIALKPAYLEMYARVARSSGTLEAPS